MKPRSSFQIKSHHRVFSASKLKPTQGLNTIKSSLTKEESSQIFQIIIEKNSEFIFPFLISKDLFCLRATCKVAFYFVHTFQIWNMMVEEVQTQQNQRNDKKPTKKKDTSNISQVSTEKNSNESEIVSESRQSEIFGGTKESFLRNSFYQKINQNERPKTSQNSKTTNDDGKDYRWLPKPKNFQLCEEKKRPVFVQQKNVIEINTQMNDEDLISIVDIWILNIKQLQKQLQIEMIETDVQDENNFFFKSILQEISLWTDMVKIIKQFAEEIKQSHVIQINTYMHQKMFFDCRIEKKYKLFQELVQQIMNDFTQKEKYSLFVEKNLKGVIQKTINQEYYEFASSLSELINQLDLIYQNNNFMLHFQVRIDSLYTKLIQLGTDKISKAKISLGIVSDFQNSQKIIKYLEQYQNYFSELFKRFQQVQKLEVDEIHKYKVQKILKVFYFIRKFYIDLLKMIKLNLKLWNQNNQRDHPFFRSYRESQTVFELMNVQFIEQWKEIYVQCWKIKYLEAKSTLSNSSNDRPGTSQSQLFEKDNEGEEENLGFFQTQVKWNIQ